MFDFNWKHKDFEIKTTHTFGSVNDPYIELIKWCNKNDKRYCFTLAYYRWNDDGGELIFVGNRPFEEIAEIDVQPIWKQLWLACKMLQDIYEKERNNK